jgi:hypothetical protein
MELFSTCRLLTPRTALKCVRHRNSLLLLDFDDRVTGKLKHYVSELDSASVVRQEAPNLQDPLDRVCLRHP